VLLLASPGFLELSSSCMMEIPALAPAVAALCLLLIGRQNKWHSWEILPGILFGIALCMKLLGVILLPLAALILWLRCHTAGSAGILAGNSPNSALGNTPTRMSALPVRGLAAIQFLLPRAMIQSLLIVGVATAFTFVALDWLIDRGAFLRHFQQTWVSHFARAVSFEYGSPSDHRFPPSLLLKNWDMTIPAVVGIFFLLQEILRSRRGKEAGQLSQSRKRPPPHVGGYHFGALALVPVVWLALMLAVFGTHTPWWSYYYIHIAIPLSWCAAVGYVSVWSAVIRGRERTQRTQGESLRSLRSFAALLFVLCASAWMGTRVYLQIAGIRHSPRTYYSLVLKEIERYKPFTEWIYADNLTYSFHSGIPMPPQLAVVPLKRL
jgi:hypothetical protein